MTLYAGAEGPETVVMKLGHSPDFDFTAVTAAEIVVRKPDRNIVIWSVILSAQTTTTLTLTHVLAAAGADVPKAGEYVIYARLTVPGGHVRSHTRRLPVHDRFDVTN